MTDHEIFYQENEVRGEMDYFCTCGEWSWESSILITDSDSYKQGYAESLKHQTTRFRDHITSVPPIFVNLQHHHTKGERVSYCGINCLILDVKDVVGANTKAFILMQDDGNILTVSIGNPYPTYVTSVSSTTTATYSFAPSISKHTASMIGDALKSAGVSYKTMATTVSKVGFELEDTTKEYPTSARRMQKKSINPTL